MKMYAQEADHLLSRLIFTAASCRSAALRDPDNELSGPPEKNKPKQASRNSTQEINKINGIGEELSVVAAIAFTARAVSKD